VSLSNFEVFAGCKKEHWLLRKAILGDHTDAIPGVHGVGEKTLEKVFDELKGSVGPYPYENLFMYALDHDSKKIRSIGENFDLIMRNFELLDISRECITEEEISSALEEIRRESKFDVLTVKKMFEAFEFFSLVEDFPSWIVPFQTLI
jgi:5'-3' exonuclease